MYLFYFVVPLPPLRPPKQGKKERKRKIKQKGKIKQPERVDLQMLTILRMDAISIVHTYENLAEAVFKRCSIKRRS